MAHRPHGRDAVLARDVQDFLDAGVADAALGRVDDALEGQIVVLGLDQPQIGVGVADFRSLEEARAADDDIGNGQHQKAFFKRPHLKRRANKDGHVLVIHALLARGLDLVGDQAGLGLAVPDAAHADLVAAVVLGPQGLAQSVLIGRDQGRGRAQDVLGRAVVALQSDDLGAGEVALEAQDIVHLGPAPAIDRLIVIADAADVAGRRGQQPQPQILGDVGVLIFVHQDIAEPAAIFLRQISMFGQDGDVMQQQVAEVAGVQRRQPRLIGGVERRALPVGEVLARRQLVGRPAAVLPVVDHMGQRLGREPLGVDVGRFQKLLQQPLLIVRVQDGEAGLQPDQFRMATQDLCGHRVEGAQPAQPLGRGADQVADPFAHLARGLVGEGDDQ